ncbi:tRNA 4-thiouridine(8) synthase ThiI [Neglecta sp. X4]|uniref:tRNA uracil 4-sulfurtransferase ThiI n=1 Tax=unclassified Neglectibacter TaxID=2632164 RepID=UPI00136E0D17|nr:MULTISPECIES: tRNA uracil 4-sulfurtransferase ThiI [unclassified Neglectibacter]NBI17351.1 tRNA 4-thiouridine(8) synthase ThiI [Neglectibacter sp. 59]NBJ72762.1 tRNA 4-thiouridine(8) synthase ThiI [Neglectibacter sp. X4]NCE80645.1 tRNA 4-thiouridine(8) synthase ThiI [Neglectibacter sp. X58]
MEKEIILLKLGEIALKGLNRRAFEDVLIKNIRRRLKSAGEFSVYSRQSTVYVEPKDENADMDLAEERCGKVFGVVAYTRAGAAEKDLLKIREKAAEYLREPLEDARTFKVECKRSDKKFPYKSPEISAEVGGYLLEAFPHLRVDVHNPDITVRVEVREAEAYVHADPRPGAGGIPVGTGGKGLVLISGGLDSPVAAWMMAKRGVELTAVHFASPPYTSELAHDKVVRLLQKVGEYAGRIKMVTVNLTRLQEGIRDKCPEELHTVILRRFMLRAARQVAEDEGCGALITGESLGQVASQTMQAIACTDAVAGMPVFRPLIGADKSEIVKTAVKIGTYDISIEPYEDCCTIFTPKHPRTKPILHFVEDGEKAIDGEALLREALEQAEARQILPELQN